MPVAAQIKDFAAGLRKAAIDEGILQPSPLEAAQDPQVIERGSLLPIGVYKDPRTGEKSSGLAWPQAALDTWGSMQKMAGAGNLALEGGSAPSEEIMPTWEDAMNIGGVAMVGSLPMRVPQGALRTFGGPKAKTADLTKLAQAEEMLAKGAKPEAIRRKTGWSQGADDKWRFEISDEAARLKSGGVGLEALGGTKNLSDIFEHPELFAAYPEMRNILAQVSKAEQEGGIRGLHGMMPAEMTGKGRPMEFIAASSRDAAEARSTFLHELQHSIQKQEEFAKGGSGQYNPRNEAWEDYSKLADAAVKGPYGKELQTKLDEVGFPAGSEGAEWFIRGFPGESDSFARARYSGLLAKFSQGNPKGAAELGKWFATSPAWKKIRSEMEFASGKVRSALSAPQYYERLAGEVEARNVQKRADYSAAARAKTSPKSTQDFPKSEQIVKFGYDPEPSASMKLPQAKDLKNFSRSRLTASNSDTVSSSKLYDDYMTWAKGSGQDVMNKSEFSQWMSDQGFQRARIGGRDRYIGVKMKDKAKGASGALSLGAALVGMGVITPKQAQAMDEEEFTRALQAEFDGI